MNPRQRRGALLLILAVIGALGVIMGVAAYVSNVQSQLGPMQTVVRLTADVDHLAAIPASAVEEVDIPQRWAPAQALRSASELQGFVASTSMEEGTVLQRASITEPPDIAVGQREVAILVSPETGVGGKIRAGDVVDIYATFPAVDGNPARSELVLQAVRIVDIAPAVQRPDPDAGFANNEVVPVTFALDADDALVLAYAESFASQVRLGLRVPDDTELIPDGQRRYQQTGGGEPGGGQ